MRLAWLLIPFLAACTGASDDEPSADEVGGTAGSSEQDPSQSDPSGGESEGTLDFGRSLATADGRFEVRYTPSPDPIPLNDYFELQIELAGVDGREGVGFEIDADMPGHNHGMNTKPVVDDLGDGKFRVHGMLFHMPGHWEIYADVIEGEQRSKAVFNVMLGHE